MGIAAVIGIVSSLIQIARSFGTPPPPEGRSERLFAELDALGRGEIGRTELEQAFDRLAGKTGAGAERLFAKLDADGDGRITRSEFTGSIERLADQLEQHFMRVRLHGEGAPPPADDAGFTREALAGPLTSLVSNFDRADANSDGRLSLGEIRAWATAAGGAPADGSLDLMLQVVRLMQAYGLVGGTGVRADTARRVADQA